MHASALRFGNLTTLSTVRNGHAPCVRPGLGRLCVETELAATEKSATTLSRHKRAYDRMQLVADRKYPVAESRPCSTNIKQTFSKIGSGSVFQVHHKFGASICTCRLLNLNSFTRDIELCVVLTAV